MTTPPLTNSSKLPVLILGAGPSGLLLAQTLRRHGVPFRLFERDDDFTTFRGPGWGLTLNWSLPVLRDLLPDDLGSVESIRNICVDKPSVEEGKTCRFPFYDLSNAERRYEIPSMPETKLIRVTRERLRRLLATKINIEWNKVFKSFDESDKSVTITFEDGSSAEGCLLVACDGGKSRVRAQLLPDDAMERLYEIPVRMLGIKVDYEPEEAEAFRQLDTFCVHGNAPNRTFAYIGVLDSPGNNECSTDKVSIQACVSWPYTSGVLGRSEPIDIPETNDERTALLNEIANTWAEPFKSLITKMPLGTEVKGLVLKDWLPSYDLQTRGRTVLMGDALHLMAMYRGEGASHSLADVEDFASHVLPILQQQQNQESSFETSQLRQALSMYEQTAVHRARPGVLASRQAATDAHTWGNNGPDSPLLSRRQRNAPFVDPATV